MSFVVGLIMTIGSLIGLVLSILATKRKGQEFQAGLLGLCSIVGLVLGVVFVLGILY